jgi:hypothetical protein
MSMQVDVIEAGDTVCKKAEEPRFEQPGSAAHRVPWIVEDVIVAGPNKTLGTAAAGYDALQSGSVQEEGMPASPHGPVSGIVEGIDAHATAGEEGAAVPARRYPMRMRKPPSEWWDVSRRRESSNGLEELPEEVGGMAMLASLRNCEPASFTDSLKSEEAIEWRRACDEELASLLAHGTRRMEKPAPGVSGMGSMFEIDGVQMYACMLEDLKDQL